MILEGWGRHIKKQIFDDVASKLWLCSLPVQTWSQLAEQSSKLFDGHSKVLAKCHLVKFELWIVALSSPISSYVAVWCQRQYFYFIFKKQNFFVATLWKMSSTSKGKQKNLWGPLLTWSKCCDYFLTTHLVSSTCVATCPPPDAHNRPSRHKEQIMMMRMMANIFINKISRIYLSTINYGTRTINFIYLI